MPKSQKTLTGSVLRLAGSLVSIALLVYILKRQGWGEMRSALDRIAWWYALAGFGVICVSRLATVGRWYVLLRALGVKIPLKETVSLTFAGLFSCNFLPTSVGGDVARLAGAVQLGYDAARSAASLLLDRMISLIGFMFVVPFALPAFLARAHMPFTHGPGFFMLAPGIMDTSDRKKMSLVSRTGRLVLRAMNALLLGMRRPGYLVLSLCFTFVHMLGYFSAIWFVLRGMGEPMPLWTIAMLWSIVYLVTMVPISINGLGWQEVSVTYVFSHAGQVFAGVGHVSLGAAATVAVFMRLYVVAASLPGAAFMPSIVAARAEAGS